MKNELSLLNNEVIKKLDGAALSVLGESKLQGFEKAYLVSNAIHQLDELLTKEYMQPIMKLQGTALGFRTDKDKSGGYDEATVKRCLIEAVLKGLQPVGNQFNIIAGNMYPTKEGCGELLKKVPGLFYKLTPALPRVNSGKDGAAVIMKIEYSIGGGEMKVDNPEFAIKMDNYTSLDAVIGKATRKARMWLYNTITGSDLVDGDVQDIPFTVTDSKTRKSDEEIERERWASLFKDCKTPAELMAYKDKYPTTVADLYEEKMSSFLD